MSILDYKPCYISSKYRRHIEKSDHITLCLIQQMGEKNLDLEVPQMWARIQVSVNGS